MALVKEPAPELSEVQASLVVGLTDVLQQTPPVVTDAPPPHVTSPPIEALFAVMEEAIVASLYRSWPSLSARRRTLRDISLDSRYDSFYRSDDYVL